MQRQWDRLIGFGVRGYKRSTSADVNLFSDLAQASGKTILEVVAITACPWCGEAVATCQVAGRATRAAAPGMADRPRSVADLLQRIGE